MSLLELKDIVVTYQNDDISLHALNQLSLSVEKGEFVSIIGKSGCGKSTLLNVIGLISSPTEGTYSFQGNEVQDISTKDAAKLRNHNIGFIVQHFALIPDYTVYENIALPLHYQKMSGAMIQKKVEELLEELELQETRNKYPYQLSGGQCQRVAIARALITKPQILLADEPTGALDEETGRKIMEILEKINKKGTTILMVTHDLDLANRANRVIKMSDGKIIG